MGEEKKEKSLEGLAYALFRGFEGFKNALDEYESNPELNENSQDEVWNRVRGTIAEVTSKYDLSFDSLIDILPPEYRPLARVVKRMRVDQAVDLASDIIKEYTREEDGSYRSVEEVATRVIGKRILRKIFSGDSH